MKKLLLTTLVLSMLLLTGCYRQCVEYQTLYGCIEPVNCLSEIRLHIHPDFMNTTHNLMVQETDIACTNIDIKIYTMEDNNSKGIEEEKIYNQTVYARNYHSTEPETCVDMEIKKRCTRYS